MTTLLDIGCSAPRVNYSDLSCFWSSTWKRSGAPNETRDNIYRYTHTGHNHFRYQIFAFFSRLIFFCSCRVPYRRASAVGGQPGDEQQGKKKKNHWATVCVGRDDDSALRWHPSSARLMNSICSLIPLHRLFISGCRTDTSNDWRWQCTHFQPCVQCDGCLVYRYSAETVTLVLSRPFAFSCPWRVYSQVII